MTRLRESSGPPDPRDLDTRCFRLVLEYDGSQFEGWQIQAGARGARTVQGVLEAELAVLAEGPVRVRGAGRTDAGVHALAQVASARLATRLDTRSLLRALNGRLPRDLALREIAEVPADWDALREARGKHYRYQIWNGPTRSPLRAARWAWIVERLDVGAMRQAAECFVGRHDFAAFQGAGSPTRTTVRTLEAIEVSGAPGAEVCIDVRGEGFLRHMVRNLAGTLTEIGRGRWAVERAAEVLAARDRAQAGPTAPAVGLVLVEVRDSWSEGRIERRFEPDLALASVDARHPVG
jgi:tRNA pseudouridine38-40 synthase